MNTSPSAVAALAALFAVPTLAFTTPAAQAPSGVHVVDAEVPDAIRPAAAPQVLSLTDGTGAPTTVAVQGLETPSVQAAPDTAREVQVLTEPIETEEFFGVGLSSTSEEWTDQHAAVRVLEAEGWTPWLEVDTCLDCDGLVLTGGATAVQVQVSGQEPLPADLQVTLIPNNPSGDAQEIAEPEPAREQPSGAAVAPMDAAPPATAPLGDHPAPASDVIDGRLLNIVSRDDWGAEETAPTTWEPEYYDVGAATLHHTAGTNSYTIEESAGLVRAIHYYHTVTLGWGDIGYNVLVDRFGQVFEGRQGTRTAPHGQTPQAAHAGSNSELSFSYNQGTFGLSVMGTYEHVSPADHVFEQIEHLLVWQFTNAEINALGEHTFVGENGSETHPRVFGHNAVSATVCPGPYIEAQIPTIRANVADRTGW